MHGWVGYGGRGGGAALLRDGPQTATGVWQGLHMYMQLQHMCGPRPPHAMGVLSSSGLVRWWLRGVAAGRRAPRPAASGSSPGRRFVGRAVACKSKHGHTTGPECPGSTCRCLSLGCPCMLLPRVCCTDWRAPPAGPAAASAGAPAAVLARRRVPRKGLQSSGCQQPANCPSAAAAVPSAPPPPSSGRGARRPRP